MSDDQTKPNVNASKPKVKIFSTNWCGFCKMAKAYFESKGIAYEEINIEEDQSAAMWLENQGLRGVPVIQFDGKDIVHGFDRPQIDIMIREHNLA